MIEPAAAMIKDSISRISVRGRSRHRRVRLIRLSPFAGDAFDPTDAMSFVATNKPPPPPTTTSSSLDTLAPLK